VARNKQRRVHVAMYVCTQTDRLTQGERSEEKERNKERRKEAAPTSFAVCTRRMSEH